jgi:hypothetical protein
MRHVVRDSAELRRILALPRRDWHSEAEALADAATAALRTPHGRMRLFPIQAAALKEAHERRGLLGAISVGEGKTLLSLLLPLVLGSQRPLLLLPARLIEKTKREQRALSEHWRIPNYTRLLSYELLGRVQAKEDLANYRPDLIVADEAHKLKNRRAAVTRRVERYLDAADPRPVVCLLSGTMTRRSLRDYAHLSAWSLGPWSPLPTSWIDLEEWSNALDELTDVRAANRVDPGALWSFVGPEERDAPDELSAVRRAFARRLTATPGVVASPASTLGTSLSVSEATSAPSETIDRAFERLRTRWELPDGQELIDGVAVWRHARELSLGFWYVWDPRPPQPWLTARSAWCAFVRDVIRRGDHDSEADVAMHYPTAPAYTAWCAIRDTFVVNQKAVWLCDSVLRFAQRWLKEHEAGLVWTDHIAFGDTLEELSGVPYFRDMGYDKEGRYIEEHTGPAILSVDANREGRNLQYKWRDNLVMSPPGAGLDWEQLLGRTHRTGQTADTVSCDVYVGCLEDAIAFDKSINTAKYSSLTLATPMKLCYADISMPGESDVVNRSGHRWHK